MQRMTEWREMSAGEAEREGEIRRKIFEKLVKRMNDLQVLSPCPCAELNPDVIVISDDRSFLFEPQNQRALELLSRRCGLARESLKLSERIRVHPLRSGKIIDDLVQAGLRIAH